MKSNSVTQMKNFSETATDLSGDAVVQISDALRKLLADVFTLYVKTKNFHWHMSGPHFRDYHLLLDEHATQIFATTDTIAGRGRHPTYARLAKPTIFFRSRRHNYSRAMSTAARRICRQTH